MWSLSWQQYISFWNLRHEDSEFFFFLGIQWKVGRTKVFTIQGFFFASPFPPFLLSSFLPFLPHSLFSIKPASRIKQWKRTGTFQFPLVTYLTACVIQKNLSRETRCGLETALVSLNTTDVKQKPSKVQILCIFQAFKSFSFH